MSEDKLFKEGAKVEETNNGNKKLLMYLIKIYSRIEMIIMVCTIIFNSIVLLFMMNDLSVGVLFFLFNQYIVVSYFLKKRKEKKKVKKYEISG